MARASLSFIKTKDCLENHHIETLRKYEEDLDAGMFQTINALREIRMIMDGSCLAQDLEKNIYSINEIWQKTTFAISDFQRCYKFKVHCAVCGVIAAFQTYEEAAELGEEHFKSRNNLHVCVVIEDPKKE